MGGHDEPRLRCVVLQGLCDLAVHYVGHGQVLDERIGACSVLATGVVG